MDIASFTPEFSRDLPNPVERMLAGNSMHWECYRDWSERPEFARKQFEAYLHAARENTLTGITYQDKDALVYISVIDPEPKYLDLCFSATGSKVFVLIDGWLEWIADIARAGEKLHPFEREALQAVMPKLAREFIDVPTFWLKLIGKEPNGNGINHDFKFPSLTPSPYLHGQRG